jgi:hypothetical protein
MRRLLAICLAATVLAGCTVSKPDVAADKTAKKHDHDHGSGPHKGTVTDWQPGDKYHVEFDVDHGKKQATVYVLGDDADTDAPIKAEQLVVKITKPTAFEFVVKAVPQSKDPAGTSSRFVGTHEKLGKEDDFSGTIIGTVEGKVYTGDFVEEPSKK